MGKEKKGLTDDQVLDMVEAEFRESMGAPGGDVAKERAKAWDYYMRKALGNESEDEDLSTVVSSDVMEVVDGIMPEMLRIFTTQDNLLDFDPVNEDDVKGAEQASDYISHLFFKRNPAFEIMFYWFFDALVQKNGYVKAYWDESKRATYESYEALSDEELMLLLDDDELEPLERTESEIMGIDEQTGEEVQLHDIRLKRVTTKGRLVVENVPGEEMRVGKGARSLDLSRAKMVGHERYVTRSDLLEMGFDKKIVDELPGELITESSADAQARRDRTDDQGELPKGPDKSLDNIRLREAFMNMDVDGDGIAELKQVFTANGKMLEISDADRQPFHTISSSPLPHKHFGLSSAEKVMDSQEVTSTLTRQILNNLYHTNNPGNAVWEGGMGEHTMTDLLTRRIGATVRFRRQPQESYMPMTVPFTAGESFPMLQYFDKVKRDRTGVASDSEGLSPEALKHVQQSVQSNANDLHKGKIELIARVFAETGFKTLFLHMHELTLKHQRDKDIAKLRGEYVSVNPTEWKTRENTTINIGLGIGTRQQNMLHLEMISAKQEKMVAGGGMNLVVTPKNIFNAAAEMVKNANYKTPEMFFTDPKDQKAPPPAPEQMELQKKQMEIEQERNRVDAERNKINIEKVKLEAQQQQIDAQLEVMGLKEKAEAREDKMAAENEKLRTDLTKALIAKDEADADREIKEATAAADIEVKGADAVKKRAETNLIIAQAELADVEAAAIESGVKDLVETDGKSDKSS